MPLPVCLGCSSTGSGRIRISAATCGREGSCGSIGIDYMRAWLFLGNPPKWWFSLTPQDKPVTLVSYRCCLLGSPLFCWAEKDKEAKEKLGLPYFWHPEQKCPPKTSCAHLCPSHFCASSGCNMPLRVTMVCLGCSSTGSGRIRISAATCGREGSCGSLGIGYMRAWLI